MGVLSIPGTGSLSSPEQVMMQNIVDVVGLRASVQDCAARWGELADELALTGRDVNRRHAQLRGRLAAARSNQGQKIEAARQKFRRRAPPWT
eukprot:1108271-Pyramimonas_sp.AAC.1